MKVLVIPEDPTRDQFIIKPIIERILDDLERTARVEVLRDPHLSGVSQAMDPKLLRDIVRDNATFRLFLLLVDRDCEQDRINALAALETEHQGRLLTCMGVQEVEVWMLALHRHDVQAAWGKVREHCNPKEEYAWPLLERRGWHTGVGRGYKAAMRHLGPNYRGLLSVCPELNDFKERLRQWLAR